MKKAFLVLLIALLTISLFGTEKIVHWMHHSPARAEIITNMAEEFMAENPGIEIEVQTIPQAEYKTKLLAAIAAGSGPDVAQIPSNAMTEFYNYGLIQPFPEDILSAEYMEENCVPAVIEKLIIDGTLYGLPTDVQTIVLFYNPVLFEKAGLDPDTPPKDWNELIEFAEKLTIWENGKMIQSGLGIGGYAPVLESFMKSAGATFWENEYEIKYEDAQLEGLKFFTDAIKVHRVYTPEFGSRWTGFRQVIEAMVFGHGAMVGSFQVGSREDLVFQTAPVPVNPETGERVTTLTSWSLVIMNDCEESEAAAKWLKYITSPEAQKSWFKTTGELPSFKSVIEDEEFKDDDLLLTILESLNYSAPTFSKGWADPASMYRTIAYSEAINNDMDPKEAIQKAIKEINIYLDETFSQF